MSSPAYAGGVLSRQSEPAQSGPRPQPKAGSRPIDAMTALQQSAGNAAVSSLLASGDGAPMPPSLRRDMEERFGHDFSAVRLHDDPRAANLAENLSVKAFTVGSHIAFSQGRFAPDTRDGKRLLSHELAHVVQQSRGGILQPSLDGEGPLENEAAQASEAAANGKGGVAVASGSAAGPAAEPESAEEDVPWYRRAAQRLSDAASAAKRVYDDPKAALDEAKTEAKSVYDTYAEKSQAVADDARAAWDKTELKKTLMQSVDEKTVDERVSDWVDKQQPKEGDTSPKAELLRSAGAMLKASAKLNSAPMRAAEKALLDGHPIQAIEDFQKEADDGLKEMKAATFSTINKWEDGKFEAQTEALIDPAAHPTLAKVEHGFDVAGNWVGKRQRQVVGGAAKAIYSMVEGVESLALHPVNAAQGLSKVAEMGSPLPSQDTLKEGFGFARDLVDPKISTGKALERLYEAEKKKQEARTEQSTELLKGLGHNYVEAAGGEFVPPESEQNADQKVRFAGKKPGEISWAGWSDRERLAEIPGLLAVDVGSFFVGGGEASAATKATRLTEAAATGVKALEGGGELAKAAPRLAELGSKSEIPADLGKAAETRPVAPPPAPREPIPVEPSEVKPLQPTAPVEAPKPGEVETPKLAEPAKPPEGAKTPEAVDSAEAAPKPAETETPKPAEQAKPPEAADGTKTPEPQPATAAAKPKPIEINDFDIVEEPKSTGGPASQPRPAPPPSRGAAAAARDRFDKLRDGPKGFKQTLGVGDGGQVHHGIELQTLDRYPGAFSEAELNDLSNMRGIPPEQAGLRQLHNSKIREVMDRTYRRIDSEIAAKGLKPGTPAYNNLVRDNLAAARAEVDHALGQFFSENRTPLYKNPNQVPFRASREKTISDYEKIVDKLKDSTEPHVQQTVDRYRQELARLKAQKNPKAP